MNATVLEMIKKSAAVPSMPQLVLRFLEIMQDPNFDYQDLARIMQADPGTVSEVLRLCNSPLFGVRQKVASLRQALTLLGPTRTRSLLLGRYLVDAMGGKRVPGLDMAYLWRRSLASAVVAARFSDAAKPTEGDEVFIAALLADIGIPILAEAFPEPYAPIAERFSTGVESVTQAEERRAVGITHAEVSAMVLAHWTLPDVLTQAVNLHESPATAQGPAAHYARLIRAGDLVSRMLCRPCEPKDLVGACTEAVKLAGVDLAVLAGILGSVESDITELARLLRIEVVPGKAYALLARTIKEHLTVGVR